MLLIIGKNCSFRTAEAWPIGAWLDWLEESDPRLGGHLELVGENLVSVCTDAGYGLYARWSGRWEEVAFIQWNAPDFSVSRAMGHLFDQGITPVMTDAVSFPVPRWYRELFE